ncbi:hypothetical protein THIX_60978 [Thiomonas sp. X19]|nr:hypothetical protein THIX_60978 [Thiomonas sp. X19]
MQNGTQFLINFLMRATKSRERLAYSIFEQ